MQITQQIVYIFAENLMKFRATRVHRDPYERLRIYNCSTHFYVSTLDSLTFQDLQILERYDTEFEIEEDEDENLIWNGNTSITEICAKLNANYNYEKFVPADKSDNLAFIHNLYFLNSHSDFFVKYARREAITKSTASFIDSIYNSYRNAFLKSKIPVDTTIILNFGLDMSPFNKDNEVVVGNTTYYPGGITNIFSKFGLVLFPIINIIILAYFYHDSALFRYGVSNHVSCKECLQRYREQFHKEFLKNKILEYAKICCCDDSDIQWLMDNM